MKSSTSTQILDVAQIMVQNRGYSAFSYADISQYVGISTASIHYHFPSKDDLVKNLVTRYTETFVGKVKEIEKEANDPQKRLEKFVDLYRDGLKDSRLCLCGMLTADFAILTPEIQSEIRVFFTVTEAWLAKLLEYGCKLNTWKCRYAYPVEAKIILSMLQGLQLLARSGEESCLIFEQIAGRFFEEKLALKLWTVSA